MIISNVVVTVTGVVAVPLQLFVPALTRLLVQPLVKSFGFTIRENSYSGVTVNFHSPKKALSSTYLLANKYSPVFFPQDKKTPVSVYLPVNEYCLRKYLLPFSYSVSIIGHNSHRFTPKPKLRQIKFKFSPK